MKRNATIQIELPTEKLAQLLLTALQPEAKKSATSRSRVFVESRDKILILQIEAKDTSALRATLNSYLRWIALVRDTYEATVGLENT